MLKECGVGSLQKKQQLGLAVSWGAVSATEGYFGPRSYVHSSQHKRKHIVGFGYLCCVMDPSTAMVQLMLVQTDIVVQYLKCLKKYVETRQCVFPLPSGI